MLERQIQSLYSALDRSPSEQVALRVRHPEGFRWRIERRALTASTESGADLATLELIGLSIGELADRLIGLGCAVIYLNPDVAGRSAGTLLRGEGTESQSNGDALYAYDSLLWSVLDAYAVELEGAGEAIDAALAQLYLDSASDEWLDLWGEFFALPRDARPDNAYRKFLIDETLRPRTNAIAIEKAVLDLAGQRVKILEPWRDLFVVGESALGGDHRMQDGHLTTYSVIRPMSVEPIDWREPLAVIDRNRAAGMIVLPPLTYFPPRVVSANSDASRAGIAALTLRAASALLDGDSAMDVSMMLSAHDVSLNPMSLMLQIRAMLAGAQIQVEQDLGDMQSVSRATVCLSDGLPLGNLNARFGYGLEQSVEGDEWLSGTAENDGYSLSDEASGVEYTRFDEVAEDVGAALAEVGSLAAPMRAESRLWMIGASYRPSRLPLSDYLDDAPLLGGMTTLRPSRAVAGISTLWIRNGREQQRGTRAEPNLTGAPMSFAFHLVEAGWASRLGDLGYWRGEALEGRRWLWDGSNLRPSDGAWSRICPDDAIGNDLSVALAAAVDQLAAG